MVKGVLTRCDVYYYISLAVARGDWDCEGRRGGRGEGGGEGPFFTIEQKGKSIREIRAIPRPREVGS
jgi:hypothetical protein